MLPRRLGYLVTLALAATMLPALLLSPGCDPCPACTGPETSSATRTGTRTRTPTATATPLPILGACLPSGSLSALLQGNNVITYVPNGAWAGGSTGIKMAQVEGSGVSSANIATADVVNSCASNSVTGETVCTANGTDIYLITGSTVNTTLTSGATGFASFTGGSCMNCGVAINSIANTAIVTMGLSAGTGYEVLDLASNSLATPIPSGAKVSEDISIDPFHNQVLSPGEGGVYEILETAPSVALFENAVSGSPLFDSAAEDCATQIALASVEFTGEVFLADLTQATFTPGSPGTWSAPSQLQDLSPDFSFSAGNSGIAVAPGTHLGVVAGEFGGTGFGAIQLPSTSGSGTPALVDWVAATMPDDPSPAAWSMGLDPHTVTAYTSPGTGKAMALFVNDARTFVATVDLAALLAAPRTAGTHTVDPSFDLVANGIVAFVALP